MMIEGIHWLGHDTFRIDGSSTVYVDPWKLPAGAPPADVILVTHDHFDHFSIGDIRAIARPGTIVVGPPSVTAALVQVEGIAPVTIEAGLTVSAGSASVTAVPAYNTDKFRTPGEPFHPREAGGVGYVVELDGRRIYHAGDTDAVPEMRDVHCDVALMPVGGTFTMTAEEAAAACDLIDAAVAVPMHYGDIVGSRADAKRFAEMSRLPVTILMIERC
jgi:L-ascorbate metabolism protein UlaG (beta-lactamase superfamily)